MHRANCPTSTPTPERLLTIAGTANEWIKPGITKSAAITHAEGAVEALQLLYERGIQVAMDDFGTGRPSLAMLRTLPIINSQTASRRT